MVDVSPGIHPCVNQGQAALQHSTWILSANRTAARVKGIRSKKKYLECMQGVISLSSPSLRLHEQR